jgi:hypothetical protein
VLQIAAQYFILGVLFRHEFPDTLCSDDHLHTHQHTKSKTKLSVAKIINMRNYPLWESSNPTNARIRNTLKMNIDVHSEAKNETPQRKQNCRVRPIS